MTPQELGEFAVDVVEHNRRQLTGITPAQMIANNITLAIREAVEAETRELRGMLARGLWFVERHKESSPPGGCVYCGFASSVCELDEWLAAARGATS